MITSPELIGP
jgi:hypothetical protein